ncbi:hypothetical protein N7520_007314 [Penicillium odoratum]|uniref:uncharacterized protein n=1 Tax=Penicillium odoratum TaxID=1167516 RepID=UPI002549542C|nr:uncharacterized protein N7520_007314 [Penicillium odoratum]KAJ5760158.1 hypothetical protein N7520_007314 [Penicillium odoratum]
MELPGSRLESASFHHAACELNVRVIGIDPTGVGLSSPQPNQTELMGVGVVSGMGPWRLGTGGVTLILRLLLKCLAYAPWLAYIMPNITFSDMVKGSDPVKMREVVIGATKRMKPTHRDFCERPASAGFARRKFSTW